MIKLDLYKLSGILITSISLIATLIVYFNKRSKDNRERNRRVYSETLSSSYSNLFEFDTNNESNKLGKLCDNFNPIEVSKFCKNVKDFDERGNKFYGIYTKYLFYRLHKTALKLNSYTSDSFFIIRSFNNTDESFEKFYTENRSEFEFLKNRFKPFYLSFNDNLT